MYNLRYTVVATVKRTFSAAAVLNMPGRLALRLRGGAIPTCCVLLLRPSYNLQLCKLYKTGRLTCSPTLFFTTLSVARLGQRSAKSCFNLYEQKPSHRIVLRALRSPPAEKILGTSSPHPMHQTWRGRPHGRASLCARPSWYCRSATSDKRRWRSCSSSCGRISGMRLQPNPNMGFGWLMDELKYVWLSISFKLVNWLGDVPPRDPDSTWS